MKSKIAEVEVPLLAYKTIIKDFLAKSSFTLPAYTPSSSVHHEVLNMCKTLNLSSPRLDSLIKSGCCASQHFWPSRPHHLQLLLARYATLTILIDDLSSTSPSIISSLQSFRTSFLSHEPISDPTLRTIFNEILKLGEYYDTFNTDMIFKSISDFLSICLFEIENVGKLRPASNLAKYVRSKTGVAEAFVMLIFHGNYF